MNDKNENVKGTTMNNLMTSKKAAEYLCISPRKLWDLSKSGRIPTVKIDRVVRYDLNDLNEFIDLQKS
jgi:hypothetical protein